MPKTKKDYRNVEKYDEYVRRNKKKNYLRGTEGSVRHLWTDEEIDMIMNKNGLTDREIALKIKHSVEAIQVKRNKIKKTEDKR